MQTVPVGLYVHLPWCVSKCPYCDFNSHALKGPLPEGRYRRALLLDLEYEMAHPGFGAVTSVFFGGGTPSLFSARTIEAVLETLDRAGLLGEGAEVSLEANPGAVERGAFRDYAAAGINRVSLGVQSFSADALCRLGRIHSPGEVWLAIEDVRRAGISQLNLDLMYGLPGQTVDGALSDLEDALTACPEHISHYQLTLEPNTLFHARPPDLPTDDIVWDSFEACHARLAAADYQRYEVSAYAKPGMECRHNRNYWEFGDYVGIGAGAHGKRTCNGERRIVRSRKTRHPNKYMAARPPVGDVTEVEGSDRSFEFMLNALRLTGGFEEGLFEARTGLSAGVIRPTLVAAESRGLVGRIGASGWRPTDLGMRFLNDLQALFLPAADR